LPEAWQFQGACSLPWFEQAAAQVAEPALSSLEPAAVLPQWRPDWPVLLPVDLPVLLPAGWPARLGFRSVWPMLVALLPESDSVERLW
jgi:hypothetical protein